jgi:hypothetical protein
MEMTMCTKTTKFVLDVAVLSALMCFTAHAQDVEFGTGIVCNTQEQTERFVSLFKGDAEAALKAVNVGQNDQGGCGVATLAYIRGAAVETARSGDAAFNIVRVLVIGVMTETGLQATVPAAMFSVQRIDERVA